MMDGIERPNYTQVPNILLDNIKMFKGSELKVIMAICRKTFGFHKSSDVISLSQFEEMTGMTRQTIVTAMRGEHVARVIERVPDGDSFGYRLRLSEIGRGSNNLTSTSLKIRPGVVKKLDPQKKGLNKERKQQQQRVRARGADSPDDSDNIDLSFLPQKDERHRTAIKETWRLLDGSRSYETLKARTYGQGMGLSPAMMRAMQGLDKRLGFEKLVAACTIAASMDIPLPKVDTVAAQWDKPDPRSIEIFDGVEPWHK